MGGVERYILTLSNFLGDTYPNVTFSLATDKTTKALWHVRKIPKTQTYNASKSTVLAPT
jgi:hypothetical protein